MCGGGCVTGDVWQGMCGGRRVAGDVWRVMCGGGCVAGDVWREVCGGRCVAGDVWREMCGGRQISLLYTVRGVHSQPPTQIIRSTSSLSVEGKATTHTQIDTQIFKAGL